MLEGMEGGFGFPLGGDPEDLLRGLREFAEQQAETVQEAQREQFATLTLNTAVELTGAALSQLQPSGSADEQTIALRDAMRVLFPEAAPRVRASCASVRIPPPLAIFDRAIVRMLPAVPRPLVQKLSERYIAGPELKDARETVRKLNAEGKVATIDVLGEEITTEEEAAAIVRAYLDVFADIERCGLDSGVSVKLTALGLNLEYDVCRANLRTVVEDAASRGNFVRIDMEDSSTTDDTLRLYRELREEGHDNVGVVLQAMLRRTADDIARLADLRPSVRLCKGIYVEPPELAYQDFGEVRASYVRALDALLAAGEHVGIATHDEWLLDEGRRLVAEHELAADAYEFQMLLGVRPELGTGLVREGHRLRIYVPFGRHWYEYSLRRLQENPKLAGYIAADTLGRVVGRRNGA
jgi:proline dehydrogenase